MRVHYYWVEFTACPECRHGLTFFDEETKALPCGMAKEFCIFHGVQKMKFKLPKCVNCKHVVYPENAFCRGCGIPRSHALDWENVPEPKSPLKRIFAKMKLPSIKRREKKTNS